LRRKDHLHLYPRRKVKNLKKRIQLHHPHLYLQRKMLRRTLRKKRFHLEKHQRKTRKKKRKRKSHL
jgi:hypothetical protein